MIIFTINWEFLCIWQWAPSRKFCAIFKKYIFYVEYKSNNVSVFRKSIYYKANTKREPNPSYIWFFASFGCLTNQPNLSYSYYIISVISLVFYSIATNIYTILCLILLRVLFSIWKIQKAKKDTLTPSNSYEKRYCVW